MIRYPLLLSSDHFHPQPMIPFAIRLDDRMANAWGVLEPSCPDVVLPLTTASDLDLSWDEGLGLPQDLMSGRLVMEIAVGDETLAWPVEKVRIDDVAEAKLGWHGFLEYFDVALYGAREVFEISVARPLPPLP